MSYNHNTCEERVVGGKEGVEVMGVGERGEEDEEGSQEREPGREVLRV